MPSNYNVSTKSCPHHQKEYMSKILFRVFLPAVYVFALSIQTLHAEALNCDVSLNGEIVAENNLFVNVAEQKNYVTLGTFYFYVKNMGNSQFELEIYNTDGPLRSYAEGNLRTLTDKLSWTLWTRDILLETKCKLAEEL
jgi:hypothetical protein